MKGKEGKGRDKSLTGIGGIDGGQIGADGVGRRRDAGGRGVAAAAAAAGRRLAARRRRVDRRLVDRFVSSADAAVGHLPIMREFAAKKEKETIDFCCQIAFHERDWMSLRVSLISLQKKKKRTEISTGLGRSLQ